MSFIPLLHQAIEIAEFAPEYRTLDHRPIPLPAE
jgi:hypothetical protein